LRMRGKELLDGVYNLVRQANGELGRIWIEQIVFSWRWWFEMTLAIIPWIVWVKIRDKENTARLLFVGLTVMIVTNFLDIIGASFNLWHYDYKDLPFVPIYLPWDMTLFPVSVMVMLQFKPEINVYIKAVIFSFLCSFIFEPLFSLIDMYHPVHWKYWYSFVIYAPLYWFFNYIYKSKLWEKQS
jgi:hypothetical protein